MVGKRAQARGQGRAWAVAGEGALSGQGRPSRAGFQELGEQSASAPQKRMRCESNLGDSASECQIAKEGRARRQFVSNCRARARVKMVIFGSRGQNAR
eukprot:5984319-Pleurochrysis_carterae.AAC.1